MQDIPQQGSIADIFIPRLIARLHHDGFEGAVRVTLGPTTKILYFKRGEIASAASNAETDRLANILILDGRLTAPQLDLARSRMQAGGSLGKILIEMGFLTPAELLQGARRQVRQILASCCTLSSGSYQVDSGPLPAEVTVLGLPTRRVLFDAILQARDRRWIVRQMGSMESVYRPTATLASGLEALKLEPAVDQIARMVDGAQTLRDLSSHTSMDDFMVSKVVLALEVLGFVELAGVPLPSAPVVGRSIPIESDPGEIPLTDATDGVGLAGPDEEVELVMDDADGDSARPGGAGGPRDDVEPGDRPPTGGPAPPPDDDAPGPGLEPPDDHPAFTTEADPVDAAEPIRLQDDLPDMPAPPASRPSWQIDPRTGERIHTGPIELTFDGPTGPPRSPTGGLTRLLVIAVCATLLLAALFIFLVRRDHGGSPSDEAAVAVASRPSATTGATGLPDEVAAPESAADRAATGSAVGQVTEEAEPSVPEPVQAGPRETAPPPPAPPSPAAAEAPPATTPPFDDARGYASALRELAGGDPARAALSFQRLVAAEDPGRFTLQLMIACETETLDKLRHQSGGRGGLYVLSYTHRGRECYRALWGIYPSLEEARAAIDDLPASFSTSGLRPIVVSVGRLRPPS